MARKRKDHRSIGNKSNLYETADAELRGREKDPGVQTVIRSGDDKVTLGGVEDPDNPQKTPLVTIAKGSAENKGRLEITIAMPLGSAFKVGRIAVSPDGTYGGYFGFGEGDGYADPLRSLKPQTPEFDEYLIKAIGQAGAVTPRPDLIQ